MTEQIEYDAASSSNVDQQDNKSSSFDVVQQDGEASSSDVFQQDVNRRNILSNIFSRNYIFNLNWFNLLIISSKSAMPIWLSKMNKKLKCHQLINGIFATQFHFVTYWVWLLMHHFGTWHPRRWNMSTRGQKIPISSWMYVFSDLET